MGLIEALAYGIPSLVSTGSNMRTEIEQYNAGWACDVSVESIMKAMLKMINEKKSFSCFGQNARKLALNYDWDKIACSTHFKYGEIINR